MRDEAMAKAKKERKTPLRDDGRMNTTVYMFPETIKRLKMAALQDDRNSYEIVEEAVLEWLKRRKTKQRAEDR